jgi:hypothetical protein
MNKMMSPKRAKVSKKVTKPDKVIKAPTRPSGPNPNTPRAAMIISRLDKLEDKLDALSMHTHPGNERRLGRPPLAPKIKNSQKIKQGIAGKI